MDAIRAHDFVRLFPTVRCPGCQTLMAVVVTESMPNGMNIVTYRCDGCGTETERIIKDHGKR